MSFNKTQKEMVCDVKGCNSSTSVSYPGGIYQGWVFLNGIGKDVCPNCRRKFEEKFGKDWKNLLEFKDVY